MLDIAVYIFERLLSTDTDPSPVRQSKTNRVIIVKGRKICCAELPTEWLMSISFSFTENASDNNYDG